MIDFKLKLSNDLKLLLGDCEEIWIAVAMVSDAGFNFIQKNINQSAKQNYLIGVGLPTSPSVLRQLMDLSPSDQFRSRIYHKESKLFHPKMYIIKTGEKFYAFVGSGNCTDGGLDTNVEISAKIDDPDFCKKSLDWFNSFYKNGRTITEDFLQAYESLFHKQKERMKKDSEEIQYLFSETNETLNLDKIDFTNQFFKKEHFQAFEGNKPRNRSAEVNAERINVRAQLYRLHDKILPEIKAKKWNLAEHYVAGDIVSSAVHGEFTADDLQAMWLHYGRDKKEIKAYGELETPLKYMRLQVIIHKNNIGLWNRIGKDNGSQIDRDNLKKKLKNDPDYRAEIYRIISTLPQDFYIELNNERKYIGEFETEEQLAVFLLSASYKSYFIIGNELRPDDVRLSTENIVDTVIDHFELLLPTYELIKHKW